MAKQSMLVAIPFRRSDFATHKLETYAYMCSSALLILGIDAGHLDTSNSFQETQLTEHMIKTRILISRKKCEDIKADGTTPWRQS